MSVFLVGIFTFKLSIVLQKRSNDEVKTFMGSVVQKMTPGAYGRIGVYRVNIGFRAYYPFPRYDTFHHVGLSVDFTWCRMCSP